MQVVDSGAVEYRQRGAVEVNVLAQDFSGGVGLGQHLAVLAVDEAGGRTAHGLGHPLTQGIVDVFGGGRAVVDDRQQAVVGAVSVGPLALGGNLAVGVIGGVVAL